MNDAKIIKNKITKRPLSPFVKNICIFASDLDHKIE